MATTIGAPPVSRLAAVTAAIAAVGPTERSMPPEMMTSVIPSAMQALIEDCCRMLRRFGAVRKVGASAEKITKMSTRPISVPASRSSNRDKKAESPVPPAVACVVAMISTLMTFVRLAGRVPVVDACGSRDCGIACATIASSLS